MAIPYQPDMEARGGQWNAPKPATAGKRMDETYRLFRERYDEHGAAEKQMHNAQMELQRAEAAFKEADTALTEAWMAFMSTTPRISDERMEQLRAPRLDMKASGASHTPATTGYAGHSL